MTPPTNATQADGDRDRTVRPTDGAETLINVLSDDYVREFLREISHEPKTPRTLAETSGASRPTVYRRLNRLQELGLVAETEIDGDGRQRRAFRATLDRVDIELGDKGFDAAVTVREPTAPRDR